MIDDAAKKKGEEYLKFVCKDCKAKLLEQMKSVKKTDALFPKKGMNKFTNILCVKCHRRIVKVMKKQGAIL